MRIAFIHARSSFLPEMEAYQRFFKKRNIETISADFADAKNVKADVMWWVMGLSRVRKPGTVTIHEYTSASAPPLAPVKNLLKRTFNSKPDFRLFLNDYVKQTLRFNDQVPFGYRDMGIDVSLFYPQPARHKDFDFIYVGNVHYTRRLNELLNHFSSGPMKDRSLLILSRNYQHLQHQYARYENIFFKGPVAAGEVCNYINAARFAINYIPDISPYNRQTSTKLLEYAACRVPIISTSYQWINDFQRNYGGQYFFLEKDLSNLQWEAVNGFDYSFPELSAWEWEKQIEGSGVIDFLESR
jgi:glycosyltransferase involved in cell wall biosynthesis